MKKTNQPFAGKLIAGVVVASFAMLSGSASASIINMETAYSTSGSFASAAAYRASVENSVALPTAGYGKSALAVYDGVTNSGLFGSYTNIAFDITVDFGVTAAKAGLWEIRLGTDFGRGGAVFLDGVEVALNSNSMWWDGVYSNPTEYFDLKVDISAGNHVLEVYGLEDGNDGAQQGQFKAAGDNGFTTFSSRDGLNHVVPEPTTLALLGVGLFGFGLTRRRKQ